jgi:hypothetical protein
MTFMVEITEKTQQIIDRLGIDPSEVCSCYYCISHFPISEIQVWTKDETSQAICPICFVDSVILGDIPNIELEKLYEKWFNTFSDEDE